MFSLKRVGQLFGLVVFGLAGNAWADDLATNTYAQNLKITETLQPQNESPLGEQVNLYTGEVTFRHADVVLEGTGPTLSLIRESGPLTYSSFSDWTLSVPRIETLTSAPLDAFPLGSPGENWVMAKPGDPDRYARCTKLGKPYSKYGFGLPWWFGIEMVTDTGERQPLLRRAAENPLKPTFADPNGQTAYPAVTHRNWQVGCLPQTSNGQAGEGFFVVSPDGTKYWFDVLTGEREETLYEDVYGVTIKQPRMMATMFVSRIEDRFGNWLKYQYDGDKLIAITASDGRSVAIAWRADKHLIDKITVQPASAQPRIWSYLYAELDSNYPKLSQVVLPDQSRWSFNIHAATTPINSDTSKCHIRSGLPVSPTPSAISVTSPSGLTGTFTFKQTWHAHSYVPSGCVYPVYPQEFEPYEEIPPLYSVSSLVKKEFSGPGLPTQAWTYAYSSAEGSTIEDPCAATQTCLATKWVDATDPKGNRTRYTYNNRSGETDGQLLQTFTYQGAGTWLRSDVYTYAKPNEGPWPVLLGSPMAAVMDRLVHWMPLKTRTTYQQGVTFTWQANSFDQYANPLSETRSNTLGYLRSNSFTYNNATYRWVIGQPESTTCIAPASCAGQVERKIVYDSYALPRFFYAFGKFQGLRHNNADGTFVVTLDGNNNSTLFTNWKRGIPQTIKFADGTTKKAVVNDHGQIDSVTDENGYVTKYSYNVMGRLTLVDYPDGDDVNWANTTRSFVQVQAAEYGIAAGHWRQTVSTGNGIQETYFDARWQPVLTREYDASNVAATQRFVGRSFDHAGRETFVAYPLANAPDYPVWNGLMLNKTAGWLADAPPRPSPLCHPQPECQPDPNDPRPDPDPDPRPDPPPPPFPGLGIHTAYDALGRVVTVQQDSEFGKLTTLSQYLDGLQTRVTNPRGFQTTTTYMAYDQPTSDWPRFIAHPEGAYTDIVRDAYGKPLHIARSNADLSQWNARYYAYDSNQRLCKQSEPETGTTAFGYDAAGNLTWSAAGLPWSVNPPCEYTYEHAQVVPKRVDRTYDARNRLQTLRHPDGLGDQDWTYTPDGLPLQVIAYNGAGQTLPVTTAYAYNKRRLLNGQGESLNQPELAVSGIGYGYDANGHLASQSYPTGLVVSYAPNALGQPTAVSSPGQNYATGLSYHPNGAIKQFTYGNGLVHTMTQNLRQLPETSCDYYISCGAAAALNDSYDYDFNGNVAAISDGRTLNRGNRTMTYDGLDRLTNVVSPMFTQASYSYDVLDNLTHANITGGNKKRDHYYCYDAQQHLTNVKTGSCNGVSVIGLGYDERGNLANKNGQLFKFDFGNRLREVPGKESYRYDGLGRRVLATHPTLGRIGSQYSRSGQLLYQRDERMQRAYEYVYLAGTLLAKRNKPLQAPWVSVEYQHTDSLGSPIAATDLNRNIFDKKEFEPYGLQINGVVRDGPNYTGHVVDTATGMLYMQQRYYDPYVPHFNSRDPVAADTGVNFNAYHYGAGNPYRNVDPDGRMHRDLHNPCNWGGCFGGGDGARHFSAKDIEIIKSYDTRTQTPIALPRGSAITAELQLLQKKAASAMNRAGRELLARGLTEHLGIYNMVNVYMSIETAGEGKAFASRAPAFDIVINSEPFSRMWEGHQIGMALHEVHHFTQENRAIYERQVRDGSQMGPGTPYENNAFDFQERLGFPASGYFDF